MGNSNLKAFTIVELLVVIVVIGILAAISVISYSGISNKAIAAELQNDLDSNAKLLKMYNVEYGYYPSSFGNDAFMLAVQALGIIRKEIVPKGADYLQVCEYEGTTFWLIDDIDHVTALMPEDY